MAQPSFSQRLSAAAHQGLPHANPLSEAALEGLVERVLAAGGPRVLDLGCGSGATARALAARGAVDVLGLDINPDSLAQARQRAEGQPLRGTLRWQLGTIDDLSGQAPFDVLWCMGSSHALGGPFAALQRAHDWLRPEGLLVLGDLEWSAPPPADMLAALGMKAADLWAASQALAVFEQHGWTVQYRVLASAADMQACEDGVDAGRRAFAQAIEAEEPEAAARVRGLADHWRDLMGRHGQAWQFAAQILKRRSA